MKKSLKVLIASSAIMLGVSLLAGCEEKIPVSQIHEHTFSENWEASDSTHWHKATCEHTDVMSNVEDHKFGAWNTDKEPTQEAEGSKSRICTVCQYKQVAAIAKLDHTHVFSTEWSKDAEYHWHDATCHSDVRTAVAEHTWGNWTTTVVPTETSKGLRERSCSVCDYKQTEEVDKTLHIHTYASEWSKNETSHWKAATCEHDDSFKDFADHQFGEPVVVESTETVAGSKTYTCGVCGYVKVENLPLAEHTHTWSTGANWGKDASAHWRYATCDCEDNENLRKDVADHEWGAWGINQQPTETVPGIRVRDCQICGYRYTEEIPVLAHTHVYSSQWSKNATEHWHAATCGHNDSRADVANHSWSEWEVHNASSCSVQGQKHRTCSVCGYVENAPAELNTTAHSYSSTWTYNESTHWHAATCGHAVKSGEAAHTKNSNEIYWDSPIKCSVCGAILQQAVKNTDQYIPSDVVELDRNESVAYKFNLASDSQIRMEFALSSGSFAFWIYNSNGQSVSSGGYYSASFTLTTTKTCPAGEYFLKVKAHSNNEAALLINNFTFVYEREEIDSKDINITGLDTVSYTMYEYTAKYGVDPMYNYVTIENEDGDVVAHYVKDTVYNPSEINSGYWRFRDAAGTLKYLYAPEFCYRSAEISDSPYYFVMNQSDESGATIKLDEDDWLDILSVDPYWKSRSNFSALDAHLHAWYADTFVSFFTNAYRKDPATNTIVKYASTWDWNGLFDMDFDAICEDMTYDSETEMYKFVKNTGRYQSFKVTNTTEKSFSIFRGFKNAAEYAAGNPSKGTYMASYTYIFDENGYRVNDYRSYSGVNNGSGYANDNCAWFYHGTNDRAHRFEVKPGETYYFLDYDTQGVTYHATLSQTTYTIDIDPNVEGEDPITYLDGNDFRGAKYQHQYSVYDVSTYFMENFEAPDGKYLAGFAGTPTGNVMFRGSPFSGFNQVLNVVNKRDGTLYAKWIDSAKLIFTPYQVANYQNIDSYNIKYTLNDIVDDNLVIKANDAVTRLYASGVTYEAMITQVGYGSSVASEVSTAEAANHEGQKPWVIINYPSGITGVHSNLIAMYQKQEFALSLVDDANDMICDLGKINKGQAQTLPLFGEICDMDPDVAIWSSYDELFGEGGALEGKYFAGWSENGTDIVTLDGGDYTPIKDMDLVPVYKAVEDSKVVALRYGISFDTIDNTEYVKLTILDPNLTLTTSTSFKLLMSDGSTIDLGVTEFLTAAGVHLDSATTANGVILLKVFNMNTQHANIANCVQIIVA